MRTVSRDPAPRLADPLGPAPGFCGTVIVIGPGSRVLDLACGEGRHSLAAAARGARVAAVDRDEARLAAGRERAEAQGLSVDWTAGGPRGARGPSSALLMRFCVFNYLDRARMPRMVELVEPGGFLMMETFLERPARARLGPHLGRSPAPSRRAGPAGRPARRCVHGREVLEAVDAERWRAVASVLAVKK